MWPKSYFPVSYYPPSYWTKNGTASAKKGAGGQIVAERYRKYMRALFHEDMQRTLLGELTRMRKKEGKRAVETLNHLQTRAEEANRQAVQRAAILTGILAVC